MCRIFRKLFMDKLFTPFDLANYVGNSLQTIYNRRSNGGSLPKSINIGRLIRFRLSDVDEWLSSCSQTDNDIQDGALPAEVKPTRKGRPTKAEQVRRRALNGNQKTYLSLRS